MIHNPFQYFSISCLTQKPLGWDTGWNGDQDFEEILRRKVDILKKMFLKKLTLIACVICLFAVWLPTHSQIVYANDQEGFQEKSIKLEIGNPYATVNGRQVIIDEDNDKVVPIIQNGRTMLPLRFIGDQFHMFINWFDRRQTVRFGTGRGLIDITIGEPYAQIQFPSPGVLSERILLDSPAVIIEGRAFLPVRFIAEELGFNVDWNEATSEVTISLARDSQTAPIENSTTEITPSETTPNENSPKIIQDFSRITRNMTANDINSLVGKVGVTHEIPNPFDMCDIGISIKDNIVFSASDAFGVWEHPERKIVGIRASDAGVFGAWEYPEGKIEVSWYRGEIVRITINIGFMNTTFRDDSLNISQTVVDELFDRLENASLTYNDFETALDAHGTITQIIFDSPEHRSYRWASNNGYDIIASFIDGQCYRIVFQTGMFGGKIRSTRRGSWMDFVADEITFRAREHES